MANKRREIVQDFICEMIDKLLPNGGNKEIYAEMFAAMSDTEFDNFMKGLKDGSNKLSIIAPNLSKNKLSVERNLKLAKELGHNFFERIWMRDNNETPPYLTNIPYMIVDLPVRRQSQFLKEKISIPENNKTVDDLSGQPTGISKGSKISYPEVQVIASIGLENSLEELLKVRGGDHGSFIASNDSISKTGGVSLRAIEHKGSGVVSTNTLKTLLTGMHLEVSGL